MNKVHPLDGISPLHLDMKVDGGGEEDFCSVKMLVELIEMVVEFVWW